MCRSDGGSIVESWSPQQSVSKTYEASQVQSSAKSQLGARPTRQVSFHLSLIFFVCPGRWKFSVPMDDQSVQATVPPRCQVGVMSQLKPPVMDCGRSIVVFASPVFCAAAAESAAAAKAAAAKKTATKEKPVTKEAPKKETAKKTAPKKTAPTRAVEDEVDYEDVEEEVEEAPEKKKKLVKKISTEERATVRKLRIWAIILWVVAVAAEVGAFFAFGWAVRNNVSATAYPDAFSKIGAFFSNAGLTPELLVTILLLVVDAAVCIVAAQLWKKSNRISPCLADSKLVRTLWHQLGVIMVLVCCLVTVGVTFLVKVDPDYGKK